MCLLNKGANVLVMLLANESNHPEISVSFQAPAPAGCYRYSVNYVNGCLELYCVCCTSLKVAVIFGFCVQIAKVFMILWVHIVHILLYT